jgi:hypothetical protein
MPVATQDASAIQELERTCRRDFEFACGRVLWIRPKDEALCRLNLLWPQRYVHRRFLQPAWERKEALGLVVLKTRRIFMTTLFMAWLYHKVRWYKGINAYVLANDDPTLADVYGMAQRFHNNLPQDFVPPVERNNTEVLAYAAPWDCALRARVAKHEQIGRGTTLQAVLWDEAAFSPAPEVTLLGFLDAVPRTSASLLAINSTANGEGTWFHAIWKEMNKPGGTELGGRQWQTVFLAAWQNPHNRVPNVEVHDLDEEEEYLVETFHVDDAYLAWRRGGINEYERLFPGAGMRQWRQENPNSPTEAFQSALDCIFPDECMQALREQWRPPQDSYRLYKTGTWKYTMLKSADTERAWQAYVLQTRYDEDDEGPAARLFVWEPPRRGFQYAIGVDVGLGVGGDDSAVVVMRFPGWVTVAHYADNVTAPKQFSYVVGAIADWYGRGSETLPTVNVELNNAGILINTELETMSAAYRLQPYVWEYWDKIGTSQQSMKTGWLTTHQTKFLMVGAANSMLMADVMRVPSEAVWQDMKTTYEVKPGVYRTKGADLAMAWLLALVTVYRKFARYEWGEWLNPAHKSAVYPDQDGRPDDTDWEPYVEYGEDPTRHDSKWMKLMRQRSDRGTGVFGLEEIDAWPSRRR